MNINQDDANRLKELHEEMVERLHEFKNICRSAMTPREWELFRYRTLAHLEPGLTADSEWITAYSSITPMDEVVDLAGVSVEDEDDENEDEEQRRDEKHGLYGGREDVAN